MISAIPFHGVAPFVLGMQRAQVEALFGHPETVSDETFLEGVHQESWHYESAGVVLDFVAEEDWRLGSITVESRDVAINGVCLVGTAVDQLLEAAASAGIADLAVSGDIEGNDVCYESDACGLMVWVDNGVVVNFTLFPKYDEAGEHPLWPAS